MNPPNNNIINRDVVLIVSKTEMNNGFVCIGGITVSGKFVRLLDKDGNNHKYNAIFDIRQAWEIEYRIRHNLIAPHVEDILIEKIVSRGTLKKDITILDFISKRNIEIWNGSPKNLFNNLLNWTPNGTGYLPLTESIPDNSVGFWISDKDLNLYEFKGLRYKYTSQGYNYNIKYKGLNTAIDIIPAGTLIRVSLARWVKFENDVNPKCWLQLSGWYDYPVFNDSHILYMPDLKPNVVRYEQFNPDDFRFLADVKGEIEKRNKTLKMRIKNFFKSIFN